MNASRDNNFKPTLITALNTDGKTIVPICASPTTHVLCVSDGTTGSDFGPTNAVRDSNNVPVAMGVSSSDFSTPVVIYGDSNNNILIQST